MIAIRTIRSQMLAAGLAGMVILAVMGGVGAHGIRSGSNALAQVFEQRVEPMRRLQDIDRELKEIRFRMAGVLLDQLPATGSRIHLSAARANIADNWTAFKTAADIRDGGDTMTLSERIDKSMAALPAFFDRLEKAYAAEDAKAIGQMLEEEWPAFHAGISKPLESLIPAQQSAVKQTYEENRSAGARMIVIAAVTAGSGLVLMGVLGFLLMRELHGGVSAIKFALSEVAGGNLHAGIAVVRANEFGEMACSLGETTAKLAQVTGSVRALSDRTAAHADDLAQKMHDAIDRGKARNTAIMQVSAAIEEISASAGMIAANAAATEGAARRNEEIAVAGHGNMVKSLDTAHEVVVAINDAAAHVEMLNGSIQQIGQIAVVIKEIADQTNLLALNAAIEAARAGEQGRGFAVVADEVRKLAERTTGSTAEISALIGTIRREADGTVTTIADVRRRIEESTGFSQQTGDLLDAIVAAAGDATSQIRQIADSVREQSAATEDVSHRVAEIAELTERNAASLQDALEVAGNMSVVSRQLRELAGYFR